MLYLWDLKEQRVGDGEVLKPSQWGGGGGGVGGGGPGRKRRAILWEELTLLDTMKVNVTFLRNFLKFPQKLFFR